MQRNSTLIWPVSAILTLLAPQTATASPGYCMSPPNCNATLPSCPAGVAVYDPPTKKWTINIDDAPGGNDPKAVVVSNFQIIGTTNCNTMIDHAAWGVTRSGATFFCPLTSTTVDTVELNGTPEGDDLCFQAPNWGLEDVTTSAGTLTATMWGYAGADQMAGSWDETDYAETLRGGSDDDLIECDAGDDVAVGEAGNDTVLGGIGNDRVGGGLDDDLVQGDDGTDQVCGNGGVDDTQGNDGDNDLVAGGGTAGDSVDGGNGAGDQCAGGGGLGGCEGSSMSGLVCPY